MKRLTYISSLLCAVALAGCFNDDFVTENGNVANQTTDGVTLVATAGSDTRTTVDGLQVKWSEGDAFYAYGDNNVHGEFTLTSGEGTNSGSFTGTLVNSSDPSDLKYAVYVKDVQTNFKPLTSTLTFPDAYTYPNSCAPMFGTYNSTDKKMQFKNFLSGMIRINLSGVTNGTQGTLKLSATGIAGDMTLSDTDGTPTLSGTPTGSEVTVSFTTTSDAITLDVPVPAGTYTDGITATVTLGTSSTTTITSEMNFTITNGEIRTMKPVTVIDITGETYTFAEYIASNVTEANSALSSNSGTIKSIAILDYNDGETLYVPETYTESNPLTVYLPKKDGVTLTISGGTASTQTASVARRTIQTRADGETTGAYVMLHAPADNTSIVSLTDIAQTIFTGTFAEAKVGTGCKNITVKAEASVEKISVSKDANVENITVEESNGGSESKTPTIDIAEGATVSNVSGEITVSTANAFQAALSGEEDVTVKIAEDINVTISDDGSSPFISYTTGHKTIDLNGKTIQINGDGGLFAISGTGKENTSLKIMDSTAEANRTASSARIGTITNAETTSTSNINSYKRLIRISNATLTLNAVTLINDMNYHGVNSNDYGSHNIYYSGDCNITVENGSKLYSGFYALGCPSGTDDTSSTFNLENSYFESNSSNMYTPYWAYAVRVTGAEATVTDCEIKGIQGALASWAVKTTINGGTYYTYNSDSRTDAYYALYISKGGQVTIEDGDFYSPNDRSDTDIDISGTSCVYASDEDTGEEVGVIVSITGGRFSGKPYILDKTSENSTQKVYEPTENSGYKWEAINNDEKYKWKMVKSTTTTE